MRFISILTAALVLFALYLLVLEREPLIDFAEGDRGALGRIAVVQWVTGASPDEPTTHPDLPQDAAEAVPDADDSRTPDAGTSEAGVGEAGVGEAGVGEAGVGDENDTERRVAVVALRSTARQIDRAVTLRGRTEAARQVQVMAETSGRVISAPLPRGSTVEAGDVLCRLAPGTRAAALEEAGARLIEAEINFRAAQQLSIEGFASETRAANARAALQTAQAAVARAEEEIDQLTITAPFGGVLETDSAELGSLMQPGGLCATVLQMDPVRLVGFVPETDMDRIETGAPATARLTSGREVEGQVTFIARSADPDTRTFRVETTVSNADLGLRDGQTAEITISGASVEAHLLPGSALTLDDDGRLGVRLVDADRRAQFVPVELVRDAVQGVWVTGLPDPSDVIVVGQEYVREGTALAPSYRDPELGAGLGAGLHIAPLDSPGAIGADPVGATESSGTGSSAGSGAGASSGVGQ